MLRWNGVEHSNRETEWIPQTLKRERFPTILEGLGSFYKDKGKENPSR